MSGHSNSYHWARRNGERKRKRKERDRETLLNHYSIPDTIK